MRVRRVLVAGLVALAGVASPVSGSHQATPFHSTGHSTTYICCYTRHQADVSFRMRAYFQFSTTAAANQRANQGNGIFFTMDQHDLSYNVEAYTYSTNMPDPYFDTDDDNGDAKEDEGEIVSESTSFPAANLTYQANIYWSHWYFINVPINPWLYDPDGGTVEFDENLSTTSCPIFCDKYDTHSGTNINWQLNRNYPSNPLGLAGSPSSEEPSAHAWAFGSAAPVGGSYQVTFGDSPAEVILRADMSSGLPAYARKARLLAEETITGGSSDGVVTFSHPLSWDELATLEAAGLHVQQIEVVTAPDSNGLRWTISTEGGPARIQVVDGVAADEHLDVLGIVAAFVTVPDEGTLHRVVKSGSVYLVDLSITDYRRQNPGVRDVGQNDVYWLLAGWD